MKQRQRKQQQIPFIFIAQHELLLEPKSEKHLGDSSTRTHVWYMKSFIGTLKAQPLHKHNPEKSVTITSTCPPLYIKWKISNQFKYIWICKHTSSSLFIKGKPKHLHLCSVHTLKTEILGTDMGNQRDAGRRHRDWKFMNTTVLTACQN